MGSLVTIGLAKFEMADIAGDGGPGTVFEEFGGVSEDTFSFAEAEGTSKEVRIEQSSAPLKVFKTKGAFILNASIADADTDLFAALRGGEVATASGVKTYSEGDEVNDVEKTVRVTSDEGLVFIINRCGISALLTGALGKNQELLLALTLTALKPQKAGVPVWTASETVA